MVSSTSLMKELPRTLPPGHKLMAKVFTMKESATGASHAAFAMDTGTVWFPKMIVARSWAERFEASFLEFVESAFFYYAVPLSAQHVFQKLFRRLSPNGVTLAQLMKPVEQLTLAERKAIVPLKAACVLSAFGIVTISGEYALSFVKNLLTEGFFKKHKFADVINLNRGTHLPNNDNKPQRSDVTEHAIKRITQCLSIGLGLFGFSVWLAKNGHKYPKVVNFLNELLKHKLDFNYDVTTKRFGIQNRHLQIMLPLAVLSYMDSARDQLEFVEVAIRSPLTAWFIGWGSHWVKNWAEKQYGDKSAGVMTQNAQGKRVVKDLNTLMKEAIAHAEKTLPNGSKEELLTEARQYLLPKLANKSKLYLAPTLFGMTVVGLIVAWLNQFWTQYRYKTVVKQEKDFITRFSQANPSRLQKTWANITDLQASYSVRS